MALKPYHFYQQTIIICALLLSLSTALPADETTPDDNFSYKALSESMKELAGQPYTTPLSTLNEQLSSLDYDQHRAIRYRPEQALWKDLGANLELQAFHPGWLFKNPVNIYTIKDGKAQNHLFSGSDFEYRKPLNAEEFTDLELPGVAGFRLHYPINRPDYLDELVSYLGASYFRALGRNNVYGLSARGLAINTGTDTPEEFPVFTNFYIQEPTSSDDNIKVWATLESESVTGAYQFELAPGKETIIDVTAKLYFRKDITQLGIAPLTSMYLYGENDRSNFDDFRPEVHDSDGLAILREDGRQSWRPLRNPSELAFSFFAENNPQGFGLLQRDREFTHYEDQEADYHRRPSLWITPTSDWGRGSVTLVEIPSDLEGNDNIVAFWVPKKKAKAGSEMTFRYRMHWGSRQYIGEELANVVALRTGTSGVAGVKLSENSEQQRKFVVDFSGDYIKNLPADAKITAKVNAINAKPVTVVVQRIYHTGFWRAIVDMERLNDKTAELSVQLMLGDRLLSEKMLYQWSQND